MNVIVHKRIKKQIQRLPFLRKKFEERILLFLVDPFHPILNNHTLTGTWMGYRSINITGDYRAIYRPIDHASAYFVHLDIHSNLYS